MKISLVTVCWNDAWALSKTMRSVFSQAAEAFEYIVVDSCSSDGTDALVNFWQAAGKQITYIREKDKGVYDGMNKGVAAATGDFICFMNAGDVFADNISLDTAVRHLQGDPQLDGLQGWGQLGDQLWASWVMREPAVRMASLGFCHQALFLRRSLLLRHPFDSRSFKTDSDTFQLAACIQEGANIRLLRQVLAIRNADVGLSANLDKSGASVLDTLNTGYVWPSAEAPEQALAFRRSCAHADLVESWLRSDHTAVETRAHLAVMVLDTLYLRQSGKLPAERVESLCRAAVDVLCARFGMQAAMGMVDDLVWTVTVKRKSVLERRVLRQQLKQACRTMEQQLLAKWAKEPVPAAALLPQHTPPFIVSLTTFPDRIDGVAMVVRSLLHQTVRPTEIHLNIGADEFPRKDWLPRSLLDLQQEGLVINLVRRTCHQYDKFLHNWQRNKDHALVIVDDDVVYVPTTLENLLREHTRHPGCVVANRAHQITFEASSELAPYEQWKKEVFFDAPRADLMATGAGGVLYPPGFFDEALVANPHKLLAAAPYADDIWLKWCSLHKGMLTKTTELSQWSRWYLQYTPAMSQGALHVANVGLRLNDAQLATSRALLPTAEQMLRAPGDQLRENAP